MKKSVFLTALLLSAGLVFAQQENQVQDQPPSGFLSKAADFIQHGPYSIDIGCEPTVNNGAKTFGSVEYRWTPEISSQVYFEKGTDLAQDRISYSSDEENYLTKSNDYFAKLYPFKRFFPKLTGTKVKASVSLGAAAEYVTANIDSDLTISQTSDSDLKYIYQICKSKTDEKLFLVGPAVEFNFSFPVTSWLAFNAESTIVPVYFHTMDINYDYYLFGSGSHNVSDYSDYAVNSGVLKTNFHLDFVKKVGIVVNYEFSRSPNYTFTLKDDGSLDADRDVKTSNVLRCGLALLATTDTFVRIQTGFYREYDWIKNSSAADPAFSKSWVLSVSVGF